MITKHDRYLAFVEALKDTMRQHGVTRLAPINDQWGGGCFFEMEFAEIKNGDVVTHEKGYDEGLQELQVSLEGVAPIGIGVGPSAVSAPAEQDAAAVPNVGPILGYFERGPVRWMLTERKDGMLKGVDITPMGKVHTMHMHESSADVIVMLNNDDYCIACWNCMPVGETCAVCGRINKGDQ